MSQRASFDGYIQTAWDATSLSAYMKCPTYYHYTIVQGLRSHGMNVHLDFGIRVHKGLEIYDHFKLKGMEHDLAQIEMVRLTLHQAYTHEHVDSSGNSGSYWRTTETNKNLWTLLRTLVWHTEAFKDEAAKILTLSDRPALELPFSYEILPDILYCGHIDKIVDADGLWVRDYKTTKSQVDSKYFSNYEPSTQLPGYAIASKIVFHKPVLGVQIDAMQVGVNFTRLARGIIQLNQEMEDEWMQTASYYIRTAQAVMKHAQGDVLKMPRNTEACFGCRMRTLCAKPPSIRKHFTDMYETHLWDPIKHREAA